MSSLEWGLQSEMLLCEEMGYKTVARIGKTKLQIQIDSEKTFAYEPLYEKTGFFHMRKQRRRSASR